MSKFTKDLVDSYADKLLIGLTDEENEMVLKEFDIIEKDMERIANFDGIDKVSPMTHALDDFYYELREDEPKDSLEIEEIMQNCDTYEDREVSVPKVVGE